MERPKIIYSEETQLWNLWFHSDNSSYGLLRQGVATSPNITGNWSTATFPDKSNAEPYCLGPYELLQIFNPLGGPSQDFGLFQDVDGTFLYSCILRFDSKYVNRFRLCALQQWRRGRVS